MSVLLQMQRVNAPLLHPKRMMIGMPKNPNIPALDAEAIVAKLTADTTSDEEICNILEELTDRASQLIAEGTDPDQLRTYLDQLSIINRGLRCYAQKQHMLKYAYFGMYDLAFNRLMLILPRGR